MANPEGFPQRDNSEKKKVSRRNFLIGGAAAAAAGIGGIAYESLQKSESKEFHEELQKELANFEAAAQEFKSIDLMEKLPPTDGISSDVIFHQEGQIRSVDALQTMLEQYVERLEKTRSDDAVELETLRNKHTNDLKPLVAEIQAREAKFIKEQGFIIEVARELVSQRADLIKEMNNAVVGLRPEAFFAR